VNAIGALEPGPPQDIEIFPALNLPHNGGNYDTYAVDPKGDRFLVFVPFFLFRSRKMRSGDCAPTRMIFSQPK
jgi:hypothetical protein